VFSLGKRSAAQKVARMQKPSAKMSQKVAAVGTVKAVEAGGAASSKQQPAGAPFFPIPLNRLPCLEVRTATAFLRQRALTHPTADG